MQRHSCLTLPAVRTLLLPVSLAEAVETACSLKRQATDNVDTMKKRVREGRGSGQDDGMCYRDCTHWELWSYLGRLME